MSSLSVQYIVINQEVNGQRIDNFLTTYLKGVPKSHIYRILRKGEVRVNKKRVKPSYRLVTHDSVRLPPLHVDEKAPLPTPPKTLLAELQQRILYETKTLLIINKPAGIAVHGGSGVTIAILEALKTLYPHSPQLELAHRLDADTSGCLILAKKRSVLREIHNLLREGAVHKQYWALTKGQWQAHELRVDAPLLKNQMQSGERLVKVNAEGKSSLTDFKPLTVFNEVSLMEVTLHTGRTHQIRVHAQFRGHPIVGDDKYGDKELNKKMRLCGIKRLFLHSQLIEFTLPSTGEHIKVTAPLDEDLSVALRSLT